MQKKSFKNIICKILSVALIGYISMCFFLFSNNNVFAKELVTNELEITEIMTNMKTGLTWIEIVNRSNTDMDITGFEITTREIVNLYPSNADIRFVIPKGYTLIVTNNVNLIDNQINKSYPVILLEIKNLQIAPSGGQVVINDQLDIIIAEASYGDHSSSLALGLSVEKDSDGSFQASEMTGGTPGVVNYYHRYKQKETPMIKDNSLPEIVVSLKEEPEKIDTTVNQYDDIDYMFLGIEKEENGNIVENSSLETKSINDELKANLSIEKAPTVESTKNISRDGGYNIAYILISMIFAFFIYKFYIKMKEKEFHSLGIR